MSLFIPCHRKYSQTESQKYVAHSAICNGSVIFTSISWIMFTVGSVGRHYRSTPSVDTRSICRPSSGRHSVNTSAECRPNIGRVPVEYRSSIGRYVGRYSTSTRSTHRSILDRHSADIFPMSVHLSADSIGDVSVNYRRAIGRLSVNYRRAIGRLSVNYRRAIFDVAL